MTDEKSWLAKQELINYSQYQVTKFDEVHQFDLLYVPHNVF